jgi:acetylornithine deacetylase/succinyl-diaminopimelate desuccinylase-like protein
MRHLIEKLDSILHWQALQEIADWTIEQALAIQSIPAPTFHERPRAEYVARMFESLGLQQVKTDQLYNVYGLLPGHDPNLSGVMLSAHIDTIFTSNTDLTVKREGDCIFAPGIGDNSVGVAGLLAVVYALQRMNISPGRDLWLVATTREEGLGDLGGMRAAFQLFKGRIHCVINLEGLAFGHVYHAGITVRRLHITATTPGGHSWLHFGRPSAVHAIVQLGAKLTTIQPPQNPRTTYNIGMIEGGEAINAIATSASLWLDMRSEDRTSLEELEAHVHEFISALTIDDITFSVRIVGDRPAGRLAPEHPLVQGALAALAQIGVRGTLETGSTDANVPLSEGCPAVTVGVTRGGNAHRRDEYIETQPIASSLRHLILLVLAASSREEIG